MDEISIDTTLSKKEAYEHLLPQIKALIGDESDNIANMANLSAALKAAFDFLWVGFYLVKEEELVLGPFQGPVACTRVPFHKGVCGHAVSKEETVIVADVSKFPDHIACSPLSKSEIVIPVFKDNKVIGVLDVDSVYLNNFDRIDGDFLEEMVALL